MIECVYRLRYQVYCLEHRFLDSRCYPDGLEFDEYDSNSVHFVARHVHGAIIGTIRLIMASDLGFPFEKHCQMYGGSHDRCEERVAEISRLAVPRQFRCPTITLGLWKAVYQESKNLGIDYWYAAMEQKLARLLRKYSLQFEPIGPPTSYNGVRIPFRAAVEKLELAVGISEPELYRFFQEASCEQSISRGSLSATV